MDFELSGLIPAQVVKAICGTLIHSLWEGLALALLTAATVLFTRKASADLRYKLLTGYLFLFTAAILFTFYVQLSKAQPAAGKAATAIAAVETQKSFNAQLSLGSGYGHWVSGAYDYLNAHSSTIVLIWFLIMWVKYLQFAAGLYHVYQLKRRQLLPAGRYWERKLADLSAALGIKSKVALVQSALTSVPLTLGHLKPLVLIPVGLLNNLSAAEVEAILLHELSHIRRKDYLVNMLQHLLEIIFFFNPGLLWLSALIKAERENCCDDIVIGQTGDKATYIQALLSCQEYNAANHALAIGLSGKKSSLIGRVRRIVSNNNQSLNVMEKGFLTFSMVTAVLITLTVSSTDASAVKKAMTVTRKVLVQPFEEHVLRPVQESIAGGAEGRGRRTLPLDTLPKKPVRRITAEENGKRYEFALVNGKVTDLYVNGTKVAEADVAQYLPAIEGLLARAKEAGKHAEQAGLKAKEAGARAVEAQERAKVAAENARLAVERADRNSERKALEAEKAEEVRIRAKEMAVRAEAATIRAVQASVRAAQTSVKAKTVTADAQRADQRSAAASIRAKEVNVRAEEAATNAKAAAERAEESAVRAKAAESRAQKAQAEAIELQNGIAAELIAAGVIKDKSELNFRLSADELIVNGKKQDAALQKKLSDKYISRKGMVINISSSTSPK